MKAHWEMLRSWLLSIGSSLVGPKEPEGGVVLCHDYYDVIIYVLYIFYSNINMCLVVLAVACNAIILHVVLILYIVQ